MRSPHRYVPASNHLAGILKAFRLNAYAVLDLLPGVPDSDIKICYRKKSLLIHPDKTSNPSAPDAFDRLKKAQTSLLEEKERAVLDEAIADARMLIIRARKWTVDSPELKEEQFLKRDWPEKVKEVLVENEVRRRKQATAAMREEGRLARQQAEEDDKRRTDMDAKKAWEQSRDERIGSWRDFQKGTKRKSDAPASEETKAPKPKVKKLKVLG